MWDVSYGLFGVYIHCLRLRLGDGREGRNLSIIESGRLTEPFQADRLGIYSMQLGQGPDGIVPPTRGGAGCSQSYAAAWKGRPWCEGGKKRKKKPLQLMPFLGAYTRDGRIGEDSSVQELHDIKGRSHHTAILT